MSIKRVNFNEGELLYSDDFNDMQTNIINGFIDLIHSQYAAGEVEGVILKGLRIRRSGTRLLLTKGIGVYKKSDNTDRKIFIIDNDMPITIPTNIDLSTTTNLYVYIEQNLEPTNLSRATKTLADTTTLNNILKSNTYGINFVFSTINPTTDTDTATEGRLLIGRLVNNLNSFVNDSFINYATGSSTTNLPTGLLTYYTRIDLATSIAQIYQAFEITTHTYTGEITGITINTNLTVTGTTTTVNTENTLIQDRILTLNAGETSNGVRDDGNTETVSGIEIDRGRDGANINYKPSIQYQEDGRRWFLNTNDPDDSINGHLNPHRFNSTLNNGYIVTDQVLNAYIPTGMIIGLDSRLVTDTHPNRFIWSECNGTGGITFNSVEYGVPNLNNGAYLRGTTTRSTVTTGESLIQALFTGNSSQNLTLGTTNIPVHNHIIADRSALMINWGRPNPITTGTPSERIPTHPTTIITSNGYPRPTLTPNDRLVLNNLYGHIATITPRPIDSLGNMVDTVNSDISVREFRVPPGNTALTTGSEANNAIGAFNYKQHNYIYTTQGQVNRALVSRKTSTDADDNDTPNSADVLGRMDRKIQLITFFSKNYRESFIGLNVLNPANEDTNASSNNNSLSTVGIGSQTLQSGDGTPISLSSGTNGLYTYPVIYFIKKGIDL